MIDSKTKLIGVIGKPIEHSMSPPMHNAAFLKNSLNYVYLAFGVEDLGGAIKSMLALNIRGYNVTIPYKTEVIAYLDQIEPVAKKIGAVNTIVNENNILKGYNTDYIGAIEALEEKIKIKDKKAIVLGAGGASRAICFGLLNKGAEVLILNRTVEKGMQLADELNQHWKNKASSMSVNEATIQLTKNYDILINTTSVGMHPKINQTPLEKKFLAKNLLVMDIIYNPLQTQFLKDAKNIGCKTISGLKMFVNQGAISFELFTGKKPPKEIMEKTVKDLLEQKI
ncbi:MAG: shikimate dehydrogenase [Candidatus Aenigmarchaeota archaeon]|nr:shikimate dehydrogenase [Candidatus Aenigmarchaeota archaeon]